MCIFLQISWPVTEFFYVNYEIYMYMVLARMAHSSIGTHNIVGTKKPNLCNKYTKDKRDY